MKEGQWPALIMHFACGGSGSPEDTALERSLMELARAWSRGDLAACEALAPALFDSLDTRRRALLAAAGLSQDPGLIRAGGRAVDSWAQCAVAQASVALTMAIVAWSTGRAEALTSRMPSLVAMAHPEWSEHFGVGLSGDTYIGPAGLPAASIAAVLASIVVADHLAPGALLRELPDGTQRLNPEVALDWLAIRVRRGDPVQIDARLAMAAALTTILTHRGAHLGIVDSPEERHVAALACGASIERRLCGTRYGPIGSRAFQRAVQGLPADRRGPIAERLELLANYQQDESYKEALRELGAQLRSAS